MIRPAIIAFSLAVLLLAGVLAMYPAPQGGQNLVTDPSFEMTKPKDNGGRVFAKWDGWKFEGDCGFDVGLVAHSGKTSALMTCSEAGKIRLYQAMDLEAGRYRITAYLRGLDIGVGIWDQTVEFMFNDKYMNLRKKGTFGWTRMTYVADLPVRGKAGPSFGLWAPGMFWIDDVSLERVGSDVKTTDAPVLGTEESPIAPPGPLSGDVVRCRRCAYRNLAKWEKCYACGTPLEEAKHTVAAPTGPAVKVISSFEDGNPFNNSAVATAHATDGQKSLRIDRGYAVMMTPQDWSGYDFLKVDTFTESEQPQPLGIEIQDTGTHDYWTRVNYSTVIPPGKGTLILPLQQIYVGEKSRPGRKLILNGITRLVFSLGDRPAAPVFLDKLRLERDTPTSKVFFDGLYAFDFGPGSSPVMDGFTQITPGTLYNVGRGFGLKNAKVWRAFDALQPDPLYQDFIDIEAGGLAVDVPNGKYRVFVNIDSPPGFWGEYQRYKERSIVAQGKRVVHETMNVKSFAAKYFQFWDRDDWPSENTFDKYDRAHFSEKVFDVDVTNGQLSLEFNGENWACGVSTVIVFPVAKAAEGQRFLEWVKEKRRFYFDNAFKRVLHRATGDPVSPSTEDEKRGYVLFARDVMRDLYSNDTPLRNETGKPLEAEAFAGQQEAVSLGVLPLKDLGNGSVTVTALSGPQGTIPASAIDVGYVSHRITRVTGDGAVYTIAPRWVLPKNSVALPRGVSRQFWLNVRTPENAAPGVYTGQVTLTPQQGAPSSATLRLTVRKGSLAPVDIPVGPFGGRMGIPWVEENAETNPYGAAMTMKALHEMRARGFTMFSGVPSVGIQFPNGKPVLDFRAADQQMAIVKELGFLAVSSYGAGLSGFDSYHQELDKMKAAGFSDYSAFVKAIYSEIEQHARQKGWPTVYWNLSDEPTGDDLKRSVENARSYRAAFPNGPPFFTGATSLHQPDEGGLYFALAEALHVPALNFFDEAGVKRLGGGWAFYNEGSRWTFGEHLYKAARQFHARYRLAWHWNAVAGDPYYALDSREDDYAWANANPEGQLVPSLEYLRIAEGLNDYRYLLTLERLGGGDLIAKRMAGFQLGDRVRVVTPEEWRELRRQVGAAIEERQKK